MGGNNGSEARRQVQGDEIDSGTEVPNQVRLRIVGGAGTMVTAESVSLEPSEPTREEVLDNWYPYGESD